LQQHERAHSGQARRPERTIAPAAETEIGPTETPES